MSKNIRCDLAVEAKEILCGSDTEISQLTGVSVNEKEVGGYIKITEVKILSDEGVKALGKERGNYVTIEMPARFYGQQTIYEEMCKTCAKELKDMLDNLELSKDATVLVVGLGNRNITAVNGKLHQVTDGAAFHIQFCLPVEQVGEKIDGVNLVAQRKHVAASIDNTGIHNGFLQGRFSKLEVEPIVAADVCEDSGPHRQFYIRKQRLDFPVILVLHDVLVWKQVDVGAFAGFDFFVQFFDVFAPLGFAIGKNIKLNRYIRVFSLKLINIILYLFIHSSGGGYLRYNPKIDGFGVCFRIRAASQNQNGSYQNDQISIFHNNTSTCILPNAANGVNNSKKSLTKA